QNNLGTPTPEAEGTPAPTTVPAPTKETALVGVYNSTGQQGLAKQQKELLLSEGYQDKNIGVDDVRDGQVRQASVAMYRRGAKPVATGVAETLGISTVQQFDDTAKALAANAPQTWDVVVIVGNDKTQ